MCKLLSDRDYIKICFNKGEIFNLDKNYLDSLASEDIPEKNKKKIKHWYKKSIKRWNEKRERHEKYLRKHLHYTHINDIESEYRFW